MRITDMNSWAVVRFLAAVGKIIGYHLPCRNVSSKFFFFPFLHVGGAEKVHADIVNCVADSKPWVFFTKRSVNSKFRKLYSPNIRLFNFWALLKYAYPLSVGIMAGLINRHKKPVVFGSNSLFFYLMLPHLRPDVLKIDLLHAFGGGAEHFSLPIVDRLDFRVVINDGVLAELNSQYTSHGLAPSLLARVVLIENMVQLPERPPKKGDVPRLRVLYVGRSGVEKRVHLVGRTARQCREESLSAEFVLVGDLKTSVEATDHESCLFMGEVSDLDELSRIYDEADVLLLTSSREGFPLVVMEAMAHGVVPICTRVGGIPRHVLQGNNGFLVKNGEEEKIVGDMVTILRTLSEDRVLLGNLSRAAFDHASAAFGPKKFCSAYRNLLQNR
ncbi:MAG: glycosyltransferase [Syntrophobacterales bacterium]|nr:MAG: glycosyltransferase [Syntrophobacterales bacterium]